jgi:hypothetical protein
MSQKRRTFHGGTEVVRATWKPLGLLLGKEMIWVQVYSLLPDLQLMTTIRCRSGAQENLVDFGNHLAQNSF